ncbi:MAG: alcohol dehydrogenase catalytic domain-containing protein [Candidatus Melainabacteria bacterium]|nr:alcohol dehydrogenase catalytic domain-containing protein [Candidatus Melainabacteria bacterium]
MKALAYNPNLSESSFLELIEVEKPQLTENNAIVKVTGVGVCGSDLLKLDRALVKAGTILGHEMVGVIDQISPEMSKQYGFKAGDRILSSHHVPCLECDYCKRGKESLCTQFKSTNFKPGAFCEYLELSEAHLKATVQKVPDHLSDEVASFTEPIACCLKAVRGTVIARSETTKQPSQKILVIGLGSIGLIMGQTAKHFSPESHLTGLDLNETRFEPAQNLGFDELKSSLQSEAYDLIFLCAGADATVELATKHARNGATIVVFSSTPGETQFMNNDIYYKELRVMASYSPNLEDLREALELLSEHKVKVDQLITHRAKLDKLGQTINLCRKEAGIKSYFAPNIG